MITKRNIYHPFVNKSLGFLINSKSGTYSEEFFTDINLHWQPVQEPNIGIFVLVTTLFNILAGSYVHYHLWQMLKKGDNLVSCILKAYVIIQIMFWPLGSILYCTTNFIYPLSEIFGAWFCVCWYFLLYPYLFFVSFHTTVIAIMRYVFIVHDKRIARFGKQRAEKIFHWVLGIVPIVMTVWLYLGAADRDFDGLDAMNKCNGSYHKIFLLKWGFMDNRGVWEARCDGQNIHAGSASGLELLTYIQCKASAVTLGLLISNVFEGLIYLRTWTYILKK